MWTPTLSDKHFRLPVQWVNRPEPEFRVSPALSRRAHHARDVPIAVAKSGRTSNVARIVAWAAIARPWRATASNLKWADEVDISRGDVLADRIARPVVLRSVADKF